MVSGIDKTYDRPALPGIEVPGLTQGRIGHDASGPFESPSPKLVIVMVGMPARGKSYISKKLARYLNWLQYKTKVFNAGQTRRSTTPATDLGYSAAFFDPDNPYAVEQRERIALQTLDDLLKWLKQASACVGILDATNSTLQRRRAINERVTRTAGSLVEILFLESCCYDQALLEKNILLKLSGPDYGHVARDAALLDFRRRVELYEKKYASMGSDGTETQLPYLKLIDVGRQVVANCVSGFLSTKVVEYLLNFKLPERRIWITRNGESMDDANGIIGRTSPLSPSGKRFSVALAKFIEAQKTASHSTGAEHRALKGDKTEPDVTTTFSSSTNQLHFHVWTSMMRQTIETSQYFNESNYRVKYLRMLDDLHAGMMAGLTFSDIDSRYKDEMAARRENPIYHRWPGSGGESYADLIHRLSPVVNELERIEDHVLLITHRAVVRVLLAYFQELNWNAITEIDVPLGCVFAVDVVSKNNLLPSVKECSLTCNVEAIRSDCHALSI